MMAGLQEMMAGLQEMMAGVIVWQVGGGTVGRGAALVVWVKVAEVSVASVTVAQAMEVAVG